MSPIEASMMAGSEQQLNIDSWDKKWKTKEKIIVQGRLPTKCTAFCYELELINRFVVRGFTTQRPECKRG
jgi:hypothetical protein